MKSTFLTKLAVAAITLFTAASLMAQADANVGEDTGHPVDPGRAAEPVHGVDTGHGVARISLIHGDVSTQRGDSGDRAAAALNAPIVTGDKISTGDNSRTEVQLDFANILRLNGRSTANVASLTDKEIQVQISQGSATYTAFKTSEIRPEVDSANLSVRPSKGDVSFRIEAISPEETEVTVRKGEAEVSTPSGSTNVRKGEMIVVRGAGADAQYKVAEARDRDDWDKWNDDRDHLIANAEGVHRTGPYYTGSQDLDAYGHWTEVPDYGSVWVPAEGPGWVPYRDGRWVWEPYYGWTWVSYEPWGWAPYHYGRWFYYGASWVWWPGPVGGYGYGYGFGRGFYRPIWAPAYVSFFGFGGGIGVGVGFGSFGWLPIGPCDYFHPWYGGYGGRFNQVNIYNFRGRGEGFGGERPLYGGRGRQYSNIGLAGTDSHIRGAISSVPADHFGSGRVAPRGIDRESFRDAKMMTGNLPVVPTRESLNASNRAASSSTFRGSQPQHFFGTNRPASAQSFDRQASQVQQSIQRDGHFTPIRSGESAGNRNSATTASAGGNAVNRANGSVAGRNSTPDRGSSPSRETATNQAGRTADRSADSGWHRFSGPETGQSANRGSAGNGSPSRGVAAQGESRGSGNSGWERSPSPTNRGAEPTNRGSTGINEPNRGGNGGWDRGPRPESRGPGYRGGAPNGGYERARPTLDMRQPVVTQRSAGPAYGGGRAEAPRPSGGGGQPRSSGGGGRPSGGGGRPSGGGGGHGGGRSSGGGGHHR